VEHPNLVLAGTFNSRAEAELAKGALLASGIDAMIESDTVGAMRDHVAWSGRGFRILVREEDATAAREVLSPPGDEPSNEGDENSDRSSIPGRGPEPPLRRFT